MPERVVAEFKGKKGMGYFVRKGRGGIREVVEVPMSELRARRGKKKERGKKGNKENRRNRGGKSRNK